MENTEALVRRFEAEMSKVNRPGMADLMAYIRKSDFYTAPASTKYHLSCNGGLLQHSLNVLDALRGSLAQNPSNPDEWLYMVSGKAVDKLPSESVILIALLHDLCKTHFYTVGTRNVKNEQTGKWEKAPFYSVNDKMPLGHGPKSAMLAMNYIKLTNKEMYSIWWHMGFTNTEDTVTLCDAIAQYPIIWAVHNADMMASYMMESKDGNKAAFAPAPDDYYPEPEYEDAPPVE